MTNVGEAVVRTTQSVGLLVPGGGAKEAQASVIEEARGVVPDTLTVPAAAGHSLLLVSQLRCWSC